MNRITLEKNYWDKAAQDKEVDKKYISDIEDDLFIRMLAKLKSPVLDVGSGVGRLTPDGEYGIDISPEMIKIAKKRRKNCTFKLTDGRSIPFDDNYFNSAFSVLLFQHLPLEGVESYIKEVSRVLKSKGVFVFQYIEGMEDEPFSQHHDPKKIEDYLEASNFIVKEKKIYIHEQWTWITAVKK